MNKKGFSLLEVIIATGILSISVFGVYKLIGENTKIIQFSNNKNIPDQLFPIIENCTRNVDFGSTFTSFNTPYYLDIGSDLNRCDFSLVSVYNSIDNIEYYLITKYDNTDKTFTFEVKSTIAGNFEITKKR